MERELRDSVLPSKGFSLLKEKSRKKGASVIHVPAREAEGDGDMCGGGTSSSMNSCHDKIAGLGLLLPGLTPSPGTAKQQPPR